MVIQCSSCDTRFKLADDKLKPGGVKVRCSKCKEVFTVMPPEEEAPAAETAEAPATDTAANDWSDLNSDTDSSETDESGGIDWSDIGGGDDDTAADSAPDFSGAADESAADDFSFGGDEDDSTGGTGISFDDDSSEAATTSFDDASSSDAADSFSFDDDSSSATDSISFDEGDGGVSEDDFGFDEPVGEGAQDEFSFDDDSDSSLDVSDDTPDFDWDGSADDSGSPDDFDFGDADSSGEGDLDFSSVALEEKSEPEPEPAQSPQPEQPPAPMDDEVEKPLSAKGPQKSTGKKKRPRKQKKTRKKGPLRGLFMFILFLLLLAGGHAGVLYWKGYWQGDPAELANLDHKTVHIEVYQQLYAELTGGQAVKEAEGRIAVLNMNGYFVENSAAGAIFVIEGQIKNEFPEPRSAIAVRGTLFDQAGKPVLRKKAYCGNKLSKAELRSLPLGKINEKLDNQFGDSLSNLDVSPAAVLPYTIVFGKLPENLAEFNVEVAESAPGSEE